jgi:molybdopterin molybdotransferase
LISVDRHLGDCLAAVGPLPVESVPLRMARGRVLAPDVVSPIALPGFDNSSMDGFAVRAADVPAVPITLPVSGESAAGGRASGRLAKGTAMRIMTGAPLPDGADAVVPVEWTGGWDDRTTVRVDRAPSAGAHIRRAGEDVGVDQTVLTAGTVLTSRHVALLAAIGCADVPVHRAPRVAVLSTGSELVPPGVPLGSGQIYDSNGYGLATAAEALGARAIYLGIVRDDASSVRAALIQAARRADLVLTSGGVSAGVYDTVKEVLGALGSVRFESVAMQPGMPQGFGTIDGLPIFTLPGNPVSSMVSFEVFVRPVLLALAGVRDPASTPAVLAIADGQWRSPENKRQFVRAVLLPGPDRGRPRVRPVGAQGSHLVADLAAATCLAVVPEGIGTVGVGDELVCLPLNEADAWPDRSAASQ